MSVSYHLKPSNGEGMTGQWLVDIASLLFTERYSFQKVIFGLEVVGIAALYLQCPPDWLLLFRDVSY
jgi:hypothetical protein